MGTLSEISGSCGVSTGARTESGKDDEIRRPARRIIWRTKENTPLATELVTAFTNKATSSPFLSQSSH